ncbi:acyltransferase [Sphingobium sp. H33]|uniref:Acyltransferase n=2 Tax=Sphingobium nicotianae TaxID=2782607 RepID=A0A9X1AJK4_9SPHN|nr:acyltransferase [Sphingobium nicotianae]
MVVLLHFETQGHISALPVVKHAFLFVDFFFVLSGFVIGSSYGQRLIDGFRIREFMWLRLGRVYPLHLVMLLAFLAFEIVFAVFMPGMAGRRPFEGPFSLAAFVQSLFLLQIFFPPDATPWNGPSWSIAAEIWTYLIFALVLRYAHRWLVPIALVMIVAAPVYLANLTDRYIMVFHDGALARCLFGFALGMIGWRCAAWIESVRLSAAADQLVELAVLVATIMFVSAAGSGPLSLAAPFMFFVAVLVFARERGIVSRLLRTGPFVLLGTLSYSIYMIHGFIYYRFVNVLGKVGSRLGLDLVSSSGGHNTVGGGALFGDAMTISFLALVICLSYVSYRLIERPGQTFARGRIHRPLPPAPGAP